VGFVAAVGAEQESASVVEPGEGALDDPAVTSESRAVLGLPSRDQRFDPALPDEAAVLVVVVAAVGDHAVGTSPWTADAAADRRHLVEQCEQLGDVVAVAARERPRKRQAAAVYEEMLLTAAAASVDGARAGLRAPLAEWASSCQGGGGRHRVVGAVVAARGSSLSLVRGRGAGDMMVDGDSRGRAVSGRPVFCGQRRAGARARHGAFRSRPEAVS
jgi:hypothetical protein